MDMLRCMRTTVRVSDHLLERARKRAAEENRTLTSLIEEGLAMVLAERAPTERRRIVLPVSRAGGGVLPRVDLNRSSDLEEVMREP
jgi:hypothetical protein